MDDKKDQKERKFNFRHYNLERANSSHALILVLLGAYLLYMVYMIINNYRIGETSMRLSTVVIVSVLMCAGAAVCFAYAGYIFYISRHKEEIGREQDIEMGYADEDGNPIVEDEDSEIFDEDGP